MFEYLLNDIDICVLQEVSHTAAPDVNAEVDVQHCISFP